MPDGPILIVDDNPANMKLASFVLTSKGYTVRTASNAIKFTPEGGRVTIRTQAQPGETFRLEVQDTGIGISAEDIDRLFVEFQQLDVSMTKRQTGTGLGLALTKRLVEAQGGTVGVHSTLGQGSTFFAVFPRGAQQATTMLAAPGFYGNQGAPLMGTMQFPR